MLFWSLRVDGVPVKRLTQAVNTSATENKHRHVWCMYLVSQRRKLAIKRSTSCHGKNSLLAKCLQIDAEISSISIADVHKLIAFSLETIDEPVFKRIQTGYQEIWTDRDHETIHMHKFP